MARTETVEFTNMCMICDGSRVVVIDRKKRDWPGGIVAVPTDDPVFSRYRYVAGGACPAPTGW